MGIRRVAPRAQGRRPAPGRAPPAAAAVDDDADLVVRRPAVALGDAAAPAVRTTLRAQVALHRAEPVVHAVGGAAHPPRRGEEDLVVGAQRGRQRAGEDVRFRGEFSSILSAMAGHPSPASNESRDDAVSIH